MQDAQINSGTDLSSVVNGLNGKPMDNASWQKGISSSMSDLDKTHQEFQEQEKKTASAKPPELAEAPKMQDYQTDPMKTFGSVGMMLATFGSLMTRHPMVTALNAGAEVMKARNASDYASYKDAMDKWKLNSDNAWKMADWESQHQKDILGNIKDDEETKKAKFAVFAKATDNPTAVAHLQALQEQQYVDSHDKAVTAAKENAKAVKAFDSNLQTNMKKMQDEAESATGKRPTDNEVFGKAYDETLRERASSKKGTADSGDYDKKYSTWKDKPASAKDADNYANGAPIANFMRARGKDSGEQLQMIKDLAAERHPDYDRSQAVQDYNEANKAISSFGNGKQGDIVRSLNVAYSHINVVSDLAKALDNGDVKSINSLSQEYEEQFGSPAPTNFGAAKRILADEITKAVIGSAGALTDREGTADTVSRANSFEQTQGGLDTFKALMRGQLSGLQRQYEQATKRNDFDRLLGSDVREDLKKYNKKDGLAGKPPDDKHVKMLENDPSEENKKYFDEAFGAGAAAKALGQ